MNPFIIFQGILSVFEVYLCFLFIDLLVPDDSQFVRVKKCIIVVISIFLGFLTNSNRILGLFSNTGTLVTLFVITVTVKLIKKQRLLLVLQISILYYICQTLLLYIQVFILVTINQEKFSFNRLLFLVDIIRIFIWVITVLILYSIYKIVQCKIKKVNEIFSKKKQTLLNIISAIGIGVVLFCQWSFVVQKKNINISILFLVPIFVFGLILFLCFFTMLVKNKNNLELIEARNELLEKEYNNMYQLHKENSKNLHDFKNHVNMLSSYLKLKEYDKLGSYIQKIKDPIQALDELVFTGETKVDFILNCKIHEAQRNAIKTEVNVPTVMKVNVSDFEFCSILSNLFDNAIEANLKVDKNKRWIFFELLTRDQLIFIRMSNQIGEIPTEKDGKLMSTKSKGGIHGLGMDIIQSIIEKYEGYMEYHFDDEKFEISINLFYN